MVRTATIDNAWCDDLLLRGTQGDSTACRTLVEHLWPIWLEMIRSSRRMQRLNNLDDACHDVAARLVEKLGQPGARALQLYTPWKQRNPEKAFEDWLRIITQNAMRDYLREKGMVHSRNDGETSVKRLLNDFAASPLLDELSCRPAVTLAQTARQLLEFASKRLGPQQIIVLDAWLKGASFEEIAVEVNLDVESARQSVRASIAVLRRHFSKNEEGLEE